MKHLSTIVLMQNNSASLLIHYQFASQCSTLFTLETKVGCVFETPKIPGKVNQLDAMQTYHVCNL